MRKEQYTREERNMLRGAKCSIIIIIIVFIIVVIVRIIVPTFLLIIPNDILP